MTENKKILLVEDEPYIADIMKEELKVHGLEVIHAVDGEIAIAMINKGELEDIGLVILDLLLPNADGFQVLTVLKSNDSLKHIPVVVASNLGDEQSISRSMNLGAEKYLVKANYTPREIADIVNKLLAESK